jgi:hypothetical protein
MIPPCPLGNGLGHRQRSAPGRGAATQIARHRQAPRGRWRKSESQGGSTAEGGAHGIRRGLRRPAAAFRRYLRPPNRRSSRPAPPRRIAADRPRPKKPSQKSACAAGEGRAKRCKDARDRRSPGFFADQIPRIGPGPARSVPAVAVLADQCRPVRLRRAVLEGLPGLWKTDHLGVRLLDHHDPRLRDLRIGQRVHITVQLFTCRHRPDFSAERCRG